jgi:hypothetical protein
VLKQTIKVNGVTQEGTKIAYFRWTLWDMTSAWGNNFVNNHLDCTFSKFAQTFCKRYCKVQMNEKKYDLENYQTKSK